MREAPFESHDATTGAYRKISFGRADFAVSVEYLL
jgi:hypothetical protein